MEKAVKYIRMHGEINFAEGGASRDVTEGIRNYGIVPFEAYPGFNYGTEKADFHELSRVLKAYLDAVMEASTKSSNKPLSTAWKRGFNAILDEYPLPDGMSLDLGGTVEDQGDAFGDLLTLFVLIVILVYIVMATQFESLVFPFIIMFTIPLAFTGTFLALWLTGTPLSIIALIGAIMLVGIVTKNGIVLIDFINLMRERGIRLYDAIAQACRSRLRPVLMTSLTTILGMVPMAISAGEGSETWRPMGIAVIGGMVFSTIITMIIVPAVYAAMDKSGSRDKKKALAKEFKFMKDLDPEKDLPKK